MGKQEELEITIDAAGQVQVHVKGRNGRACLDYVEIFRELLGPVKAQELTAEYYETETVTQAHLHQRQQHKPSI